METPGGACCVHIQFVAHGLFETVKTQCIHGLEKNIEQYLRLKYLTNHIILVYMLIYQCNGQIQILKIINLLLIKEIKKLQVNLSNLK